MFSSTFHISHLMNPNKFFRCEKLYVNVFEVVVASVDFSESVAYVDANVKCIFLASAFHFHAMYLHFFKPTFAKRVLKNEKPSNELVYFDSDANTNFTALYQNCIEMAGSCKWIHDVYFKVISFRVNEITICICFRRPENVSSMKMRMEMEMDMDICIIYAKFSITLRNAYMILDYSFCGVCISCEYYMQITICINGS